MEFKFNINASGCSITRCPYGSKYNVGGYGCLNCCNAFTRKISAMTLICKFDNRKEYLDHGGEVASQEDLDKVKPRENFVLTEMPEFLKFSGRGRRMRELVKTALELALSEGLTADDITEDFMNRAVTVHDIIEDINE